MPITFAMLLNLASASNAHDRGVLWGFILRHVKGVTPESHPKLDELVGYAVRYYKDFVEPTKVFRQPDEVERLALAALDRKLASLPSDAEAETIQHAVLDIARAIPRYQDPERKQPFLEIKFGREGSFKIPVAALLQTFEPKVLQEPEQLQSWHLRIGLESGGCAKRRTIRDTSVGCA